MKNIFTSVLLGIILFTSCEKDKPELFEQEAKLKIENTSTSNNIIGVYFGTVGPGETNKISSNIEPGESKTFTIDIEDDSVYDIRITSDMVGYEEFTLTHLTFYWDDVYVIELTNNGWYDDESWK
ncbi:MAG: hypothetical protein A2X13_01210 [Bacteroidetes bacterium GWC2_33_15]|nr:MAG: hypothetical protein A2X10_08415 [Bacteroidetes bacterium GWA2_33_15]OFX52105.1 MAG: hypothetical protein A2X13_01210 [Bacteroidetes bacterium GWC2_33_15]OFX64259.1 MAG: hypothetical protein A2X15_12030 [Bacteroidetes bacterium GWB2_32_14]OFX67664.1 MAG: hypothetical protein A2X14_05855 [Bacteroidetes bacterium GWD2_33_33]HAN19269.1 hypothetical protein [Bacteroidales bacterium]